MTFESKFGIGDTVYAAQQFGEDYEVGYRLQVCSVEFSSDGCSYDLYDPVGGEVYYEPEELVFSNQAEAECKARELNAHCTENKIERIKGDIQSLTIQLESKQKELKELEDE